MVRRGRQRSRRLESVPSVVALLSALVVLVGPPSWFAGPTFPPHIHAVSWIAFWVAPAAVGVLAVYRASRLGVDGRALVLVGLGGVTLLVLSLNLSTTTTTPGGLFRYEGRGAFAGPFVSMGTACLVALVFLGSAVEDAFAF